MNKYFLICLFFIASCNSQVPPATPGNDTVIIRDTVYIEKPPSAVYANQRFKDVTVERVGEHKFIIKGKAQVFEAVVSWVVEDGHNELKKGFEMTDAGAPAFGNFAFVVDVAKQRANSKLHLILFESSAKDGTRQYELPIPLY
jgi:hypothetical protein